MNKIVTSDKFKHEKVREFTVVIKRNFCGDKIPKEGVHHICIVCISIDSVMKIEKKRIIPRFI